MRFCTDDQRFGVLISASQTASDPRFFSFQLVIDGTVLGDTEDSIVYHAVRQLARLPRVADPGLSLPVEDPSALLQVARTNEMLHDQLIRSWSESLDRWTVIACIVEDMVVWVAQANDVSGKLIGPVLHAQLGVKDYEEIVAQVQSYFQVHSRMQRDA
jgi:hypothetical protein